MGKPDSYSNRQTDKQEHHMTQGQASPTPVTLSHCCRALVCKVQLGEPRPPDGKCSFFLPPPCARSEEGRYLLAHCVVVGEYM